MRNAIGVALIAGVVSQFTPQFAPHAMAQAAAMGPAPAGVQAPATEPASAQDVIARYIDAVGGEQRIRAVQQRHKVTTAEFRVDGRTMTMETETFFVAPDKVLTRTKSPVFGEQDIGFDGTVGWFRSAMVATTRELTGRELAAVRPKANVVPTWAHASDLAYAGRRMFEGEEAHVVTWRADSIGAVTEYFDVRTGLMRGQEVVNPVARGPILVIYSDYATRDGHTVPMREVTRMGSDTVATVITTALDHRPIAASVFTPPAELRRKDP